MIPEKSRKYILYAIALLFVSQFFNYDSDWFIPPSYSYYSGYWYGGYAHYGESGWQYHGWLGAGLIAVSAYYFYKKQRLLRSYFLVLPVVIILGFGGNTGGTMGFFAMLLAAYAVYTRRKEIKAEAALAVQKQKPAQTAFVKDDAPVS
jgi:hypothetical protein